MVSLLGSTALAAGTCTPSLATRPARQECFKQILPKGRGMAEEKGAVLRFPDSKDKHRKQEGLGSHSAVKVSSTSQCSESVLRKGHCPLTSCSSPTLPQMPTSHEAGHQLGSATAWPLGVSHKFPGKPPLMQAVLSS